MELSGVLTVQALCVFSWQIFDEEVRGPLSSKLEYFKAHPSKAKKDALLVLYNDIIEELQHLEAVDEQCTVKDDEDGEVD